MHWLLAQDWFRDKYAVLYQVIINRGSEPQETPEHNALQVRFLDDEFCFRFLKQLIPNYVAEVQAAFQRAREVNIEEARKQAASKKDYMRGAEDKLASSRDWSGRKSHARGGNPPNGYFRLVPRRSRRCSSRSTALRTKSVRSSSSPSTVSMRAKVPAGNRACMSSAHCRGRPVRFAIFIL